MNVGDTVGNYHVLAKLGQGGMGTVFRARDEVLHRDVAVKVLSSHTIAEKSAKDMLLHEARAASALSKVLAWPASQASAAAKTGE